MHTRSTDPVVNTGITISRTIPLPWLISLIGAIALSIIVNWCVLYLAVHDGQIRAENQTERQRDQDTRTNQNIKELTEKVDALVKDVATKRDSDKDQDYKILDLVTRITKMEARIK